MSNLIPWKRQILVVEEFFVSERFEEMDQTALFIFSEGYRGFELLRKIVRFVGSLAVMVNDHRQVLKSPIVHIGVGDFDVS